MVFAIAENGFAQNPFATKPKTRVNMVRARVGLEDIEPQPMRLKLTEYVVKDAGEHKPPNSAIWFCHDDPLQSNGPMWRREPAQNGEPGHLSRFRFRNQIATIRARHFCAMLVFRPVANKGVVFRNPFQVHDRRDVFDPCRSELHACDDSGPR